MFSPTTDLNCDMGESFGRYQLGNDEAIFPYISSCNIACGFHGGDPMNMEKTIHLALKHKVRIGAHPSYPDLAGFGRRKMHLPAPELKSIIKYQIAALKGMTESHGGKLAYVKPHGALYNSAAADETETICILNAIREIDPGLALMGLAGSTMEVIAEREGMAFIAEAFADRAYTSVGTLMSRALQGAVIHDPKRAVKQVLSLVLNQEVESHEGSRVPVHAQSICIHGDNPVAVDILKALHVAFREHQIELVC